MKVSIEMSPNSEINTNSQRGQVQTSSFLWSGICFSERKPWEGFSGLQNPALPTELRQYLSSLTAQLARKIISLKPTCVKIFCEVSELQRQ